MLNEHYPDCRTLPAINESFAQFSRPISLLSPLDLSLRASNIIPITPPSTPSPPRKRPRLIPDENYMWRPHAMGTVTSLPTIEHATPSADMDAFAAGGSNYFHPMTYAYRSELPQTSLNMCNKNNLHNVRNNFEEIPQIQPSTQRSMQHKNELATIYVDDETIVLTEDEDEPLVRSHNYIENVDNHEEITMGGDENIDVDTDGNDEENEDDQDGDDEDDDEDEEDEGEDEYVDILSNDDDDVLNPHSSTTALKLQSHIIEEELEKSGKVLTRNKLVYDNEELHNQAIDGLAKLFERDFLQPRTLHTESTQQIKVIAEKTYTDLTNCSGIKSLDSSCGQENAKDEQQLQQQGIPTTKCVVSQMAATRVHYNKAHKAERKRTKLRKNMCLDEETISPVSGTIIRKLRDDEELVVRKGDIDPAFNVVEITEEAKAILASIANKIGAYLCQLCRTLYDDAFMLAQHRCPRIMHIEYKCSECEKVFNCPANLASHRRWHKPKSELLADSQSKKRSIVADSSPNMNSAEGKSSLEDVLDGIFPCSECGKTFRRHAYLKKHQTSHQMLENLKSLDLFKNNNSNSIANSSANTSQHQQTYSLFGSNIQNAAQRLPNHNGPYPVSNNQNTSKLYAQRFGNFSFPVFDQQRFYSLSEFYLSQHLERSSAFQYVQANHLRNLSSNATNNFAPRPSIPSMMPVK